MAKGNLTRCLEQVWPFEGAGKANRSGNGKLDRCVHRIISRQYRNTFGACPQG